MVTRAAAAGDGGRGRRWCCTSVRAGGFWLFAVLGSLLVVAFSLLRGWQQGHLFSLGRRMLLVGAVVAASVGYIHGRASHPRWGRARDLLGVPDGAARLPPATLWLWPNQRGALGLGWLSLRGRVLDVGRLLRFGTGGWPGGALRVSQTQLLQPFFPSWPAALLLGRSLDAGHLGFAVAVVATVVAGKP